MVGKALGQHRPPHLLDLEIDLGDQVDHALLSDAELSPGPRELDLTGPERDLDCRLQVLGVERHQSVGAPSFLTIRTSVPPSAAR